jgi:hypothetical protein
VLAWSLILSNLQPAVAWAQPGPAQPHTTVSSEDEAAKSAATPERLTAEQATGLRALQSKDKQGVEPASDRAALAGADAGRAGVSTPETDADVAKAAKEPKAAVQREPKSDTPQVERAVTTSDQQKTGASSQAIQIPKGSGTVEGMGESFSTQLSTGAATMTVPFQLVPARGDAQPSLSLSYSSASGWGVAGVGWDIGAPFIARQTDRGIPRYEDQADYYAGQDRFVFNGGQELVPICTVRAGLSCEGKLTGEDMPPWSEG